MSFTAPVNDGGSTITSYTVTSSPGSLQATGSSSPITVTGLTNGTAYTFTVEATNSAGGSPTSTTSPSVTPVAPVTVPDAPTNIVAVVGNGEATVSFTAPTNDGGATITSYTVTSSPGGLTATGSSSPITVTGLTNGTAYTFTVTATNSAGGSPTSITSPSVTPVAPVTIPDAPTNIVAVVGNSEATVSFTAPTNDGGATITSYTVTSSPGGLTATGSSSPITVTGLTNGTAYTFTVTATNSAGGSPTSPTSPSVTPVAPVTVPDAPTNIVAVIGNSEATVSFTAPTNNGGATITSYTVTSNPGGLTATGSSSPITITGLINGTAYTFSVTASNTAGSSASSTASSSVTPVAPTTTTSPSDITYDPSIPPNSFVWGINSASITRSSICVDSQQNVYTIGSCPNVGAVIYNYTQINGSTIEQSEYGRIGSETTTFCRSPLLLIKYNSSGQVQWVQMINQNVTSTDFAILNYRLFADKNDNIIFTCAIGYLNGTISTLRTLYIQQQTGKDASNYLTFNIVGSFTVQGSYDGLIVKYDSSGTPLWMTKLANGSVTTQENITDVVTDSSSNIYICGTFGGPTATSVTMNTMTLYNSVPVPGTNTLITPTEFGQMQCPAPLIAAGFIIKYNSDGQVQWVHMLLGTNTATPSNKYSALCQNMLIDKLDNIIVRGYYQTMASTPLTNPIQTLNTTTTTLNFTQSLYLFDSVIPGTPNKIQFNLFGQIPFIGTNTSVFMKITPTGSVEWVNAQDTTGTSTIFKTYAVDSSNNFYYGFQQGASTPSIYSYVSGLLANSVINIQPTGAKIATTATNNSFNICKMNTNGTMIGLARLYSPFSGFNVNSCILTCSQMDEIVVSGNYNHTSTTISERSMYITNFVNAVNNQFNPTTSLYGILPIAKDQDVFLLKYSPTGQGAWAITLNTGPTFTTLLNDFTYAMVVKGQYVYIEVRYGSLPLRLQTFTGIDANSNIQQAGSIVMNFIDPATSGITGMTINTALLKYSL